MHTDASGTVCCFEKPTFAWGARSRKDGRSLFIRILNLTSTVKYAVPDSPWPMPIREGGLLLRKAPLPVTEWFSDHPWLYGGYKPLFYLFDHCSTLVEEHDGLDKLMGCCLVFARDR